MVAAVLTLGWDAGTRPRATLEGGGRGLQDLREIARQIGPLHEPSMVAMRERLNNLTKPTGSLGRLELLAVQLAGIRGALRISVEHPVVIVAAADHGVTAEGVSAYPAEVTRQMLALFASGRAAINVLAAVVGAEVLVVDAGVAGPPTAAVGIIDLRLGPGTRNLRCEPAMTREQAQAAIEGGRRLAAEAVGRGADVLVTGDMGIGNTTAAAAVIAAITGAPADDVVGRGTGVDEVTLARKKLVVRTALGLHRPDRRDPLGVLAAVGGFEIGVLAGVILGGALERRPVVLDGVVSGAAALLACALAPRAAGFLVAGHRSTEPGHRLALEHLHLEPLLDLQLRLGEGTGAVLALPLLQAAACIPRDMQTFAEAGVSNRG